MSAGGRRRPMSNWWGQVSAICGKNTSGTTYHDYQKYNDSTGTDRPCWGAKAMTYSLHGYCTARDPNFRLVRLRHPIRSRAARLSPVSGCPDDDGAHAADLDRAPEQSARHHHTGSWGHCG